jgi:hypothetical protein
MAVLVSDGDIAYLRTLYPDIAKLKMPTPQEEKALMMYMRGMTPAAAANSAGYGTPGPFLRFLALDSTKAICEYIREREFHDVRITRDSLTAMFLEAYHRSANSMEMVAATRELGKLHGLYLDAKPSVTVNVSGNGAGTTVEVNLKKLERMSDEDLLALAPNMISVLEAPKPVERKLEVISEQ